METNIEILDCTLRDGSYTIDFSFTKEQTLRIAKGLYELGFSYIEVGHGLGLGASIPSIGIAAETDEDYIRTAKMAAPDGKIAVFFIPTIGKTEDIQRAKEAGLDVIRIGTNITEYRLGKEAIAFAKKNGLEVSWNLMKSYVVSPAEFKKIAGEVAKMGADTVVFVDSAGCMFPEDLKKYLFDLKDYIGSSSIGFHGHNNLGLVNANILEAVKWGARVIDTSMGGMGRSAGNAQTEILTYMLQKLGCMKQVDLFKLMDFTNREVIPIMIEKQGVSTVDIACGMSSFHSSFIEKVIPIAAKYHIQVEKLIVSVGAHNQVQVTEDLVEKIAKSLT